MHKQAAYHFKRDNRPLLNLFFIIMNNFKSKIIMVYTAASILT